jgi:hypothetical protein
MDSMKIDHTLLLNKSLVIESLPWFRNGAIAPSLLILQADNDFLCCRSVLLDLSSISVYFQGFIDIGVDDYV